MKWLYLLLASLQAFSLFASELTIQPASTYGHLKLELDRPIDTSTYLYVKFALEKFREEKASFVLLELNTPGGEVFAAKKIAHLLFESDALYHMPVVAYINHWALSAGALLAYSCRYIAISPSASMGAAEPITMKGDAMESAPEKIRSALRAEFANAAALFGRDPLLAEAMVDQDMLLVRREGKFLSLSPEEKAEIGDEVISPKGKLLTLNAKQIEEFGLSQFQAPVSQQGLLAISPFNELSSSAAIDFSDWKIDFFAFLSHPAVLSLLSMGLMLGLYLEANAPGHGVGALIAGVSLALLLLSHSADAAIQSLDVILIVSGLLLIGLEIALFSTGGFFYFLGAVFLLGGLFALGLPNLGLMEFDFSMDKWNLAAFAFYQTLGWFCATFCGALLLCLLTHKYRLSLFSRFILEEAPPSPSFSPSLPSLGTLGEAAASCRPSGMVQVDGELFEACTEIGFIDKGESVKIVGIDNGRLVIRPLD